MCSLDQNRRQPQQQPHAHTLVAVVGKMLEAWRVGAERFRMSGTKAPDDSTVGRNCRSWRETRTDADYRAVGKLLDECEPHTVQFPPPHRMIAPFQ